MSSSKSKCRYERSDTGNAEMFAALYKGQVKFDHGQRCWLLWRGHWWAEDRDGAIPRLARKAVRWRHSDALRLPPEESKPEADWSIRSESRAHLEALLELAKSERAIADDGRCWDADPYLLGVTNGVVNLRTGRLRNGRPNDRITKHALVPYEPGARCPRWEAFQEEIFEGDQELIGFVHRGIGYSITGDTSEQCLFLCLGEGSNGKSTLLNVVRKVLGDYGHNTPFSTLELQARQQISHDVADLAGRRFVTALETSETSRLNEARLKLLTGGDQMTARHLYRRQFEFRPECKLWLATNSMPRVDDQSYGFWRRIRVIPFRHKFEESEVDKHLEKELLAEAQGILTRIVQGCLAWQQQGLQAPATVQEETETYRDQCDPLVEFASERLLADPQTSETAAAVWQEYVDWTVLRGQRAIDRRKFAQLLAARGFEKRKVGHARTWTWFGLRLVSKVATTLVGQTA